MSILLQFEKNIEDAVAQYLTDNEQAAFTSRSIVDLPLNHIQVGMQYMSALDGMRQMIGKYQEYDLHEGELLVMISTERTDGNAHHTRLGIMRSLLLNSKTRLNIPGYTVFDLAPQITNHIEQEENNVDRSTLSYSIKWKINFDNL